MNKFFIYKEMDTNQIHDLSKRRKKKETWVIFYRFKYILS